MTNNEQNSTRNGTKKNRFNFTKKRIDSTSLAAGTRQGSYYDSKTRGLCLLVSGNNIKTFYLLRKFKGRAERVRIGRYPDTSVAAARKRAGEINSMFDAGLNVNDIKRRERGEFSLSAAFEEYLERHAKVYTRRWSQSETLYRCHLSAWGTRRLSTISRQDVGKWHAKIGRKNGHYTANNALTLLKAIYNRMIDWERFHGPNPTKGVRKFRTKSRDRYLLPDELKRFLEALKSEPEAVYRDLFVLLLLTGARKGNCLAMRWCDLNLDTGVWTIPLTKNGEAQRIPLSGRALEVLRRRAARMAVDNSGVVQLPARHGEPQKSADRSVIVRFESHDGARRRAFSLESAYVFPSEGQSGHLADPRKPWKRLLTRAEVTDFRIHDLRRTHGSYLAATGANQFLISQALGHKDVATTAIYARLDLDPIRAATTRAADVMFAGFDDLIP